MKLKRTKKNIEFIRFQVYFSSYTEKSNWLGMEYTVAHRHFIVRTFNRNKFQYKCA